MRYSHTRATFRARAQQGQGYALCERILAEHPDTRVFVGSRDVCRGSEAAANLASRFAPDRVRVVQLDVTQAKSIEDASAYVRQELGGGSLYGLVSNAGVMWGHSRQELMDVCATGACRVLDAFLPSCADGGRVVVVSSGLGPLMHGYARQDRRNALALSTRESIEGMIEECLALPDPFESPALQAAAFDKIGFPGGENALCPHYAHRPVS